MHEKRGTNRRAIRGGRIRRKIGEHGGDSPERTGGNGRADKMHGEGSFIDMLA
jgi:hypothetical protein